jgi:hypothetical protein
VFGKAMVATYEAALPGSPTRGKLVAAIIQMMEGSDRRTYVDKSLWSDEDLDRELRLASSGLPTGYLPIATPRSRPRV